MVSRYASSHVLRRNQLLHYMVVVVGEWNIAKYTELSYDYGGDYVLEGTVSVLAETSRVVSQ